MQNLLCSLLLSLLLSLLFVSLCLLLSPLSPLVCVHARHKSKADFSKPAMAAPLSQWKGGKAELTGKERRRERRREEKQGQEQEQEQEPKMTVKRRKYMPLSQLVPVFSEIVERCGSIFVADLRDILNAKGARPRAIYDLISIFETVRLISVSRSWRGKRVIQSTRVERKEIASLEEEEKMLDDNIQKVQQEQKALKLSPDASRHLWISPEDLFAARPQVEQFHIATSCPLSRTVTMPLQGGLQNNLSSVVLQCLPLPNSHLQTQTQLEPHFVQTFQLIPEGIPNLPFSSELSELSKLPKLFPPFEKRGEEGFKKVRQADQADQEQEGEGEREKDKDKDKDKAKDSLEIGLKSPVEEQVNESWFNSLWVNQH